MNIGMDMVDYIAELSRLELQAGEKQAMTAQLEQIIAYMDVLNKLDTTGVEPMSHVFPVKNVLREDQVSPSQDRAALLADGVPEALFAYNPEFSTESGGVVLLTAEVCGLESELAEALARRRDRAGALAALSEAL